jgi:hypothetical protein
LKTFIDSAVARLNYLRDIEAAKVILTLKIGDTVEFNGRKRDGVVRIKVESMGRGKIRGSEIGGTFPTKWRVAASLCRKVTEEQKPSRFNK